MKEHPILFSAPMILAIRARRKFVTRRLSKSWLKVKAGDGLWVREAWRFLGEHQFHDHRSIEWRADHDGPYKWIPSIHMPRWASRFNLIATADAYVERLQDITEEQAIAEGIEPVIMSGRWKDYANTSDMSGFGDPRDSFRSLINSLHGPTFWDSNPEMVVIPFDYPEVA